MKVAAFLLGLVAVFALAAAGGAALGPEPLEPAPNAAHGDARTSAASPGDHGDADDASAGEHDSDRDAANGATQRDDHAGAHAVSAPRGLATAADGMRLDLLTPELARGRTQALRFRVLGDHDRPVRELDVAHERRMHVIVVRRDLAAFQHLHPQMDADGAWSVPLRLDRAGAYRVYADFERNGRPTTLAADLRVDGAADLRPLPAVTTLAVSDGGDDIELDAGRLHAGEPATLSFTVTNDGRPAEIVPYLGAGGHLVALREGDLAFLHVHPVGAARRGRVAFETTFPSAGRYRLFLQYRVEARDLKDGTNAASPDDQAGGRTAPAEPDPHVRTVAFTVEVAP